MLHTPVPYFLVLYSFCERARRVGCMPRTLQAQYVHNNPPRAMQLIASNALECLVNLVGTHYFHVRQQVVLSCDIQQFLVLLD